MILLSNRSSVMNSVFLKVGKPGAALLFTALSLPGTECEALTKQKVADIRAALRRNEAFETNRSKIDWTQYKAAASVQETSFIDHTVLKPSSVFADVKAVVEEAKQHNFAAICIPPNFVKDAKELAAGSKVKIATVIGFPFGYSSIAAKREEIIDAIVDGADELDIVANISAIKSGNWEYLAKEIEALIEPIRQTNKVVKVIIESGILTDDEIIKCCEIYGKAGIDYLKTSTGYAEKGASVHAVELFRKHLPDHIQIKASGGIRDYATAKQMVDAGATRLGCSAGVAIVKGVPAAGGGTY